MTRWSRLSVVLGLLLVTLASGVVFAEEPVTITFAWWGDPAITKDYDALIARFEELNPDIRIENLRWGWYGDATEKFTVTAAAGVAPDVFMIPTIVPGALLPLDDLLESEPGMDSWFIPGSLDWMRVHIDQYGIARRGEGPLLGLPIYSLATAIAYNQDMFAQAGIANPTDWTYTEYEEIARRLTKDVDGDGVPDVWGAAWHIQSNTGIGPIIAAYADWPVYRYDPFDTIVNSTEFHNAAEVLRRWIQELEIHPAPNVGGARFASGTVATNQGHNDSFLSFPSAIGDQFAWDIAPMPVGPKGRWSWASHQGLGIYAQTKHVEAAWRFMKFLVGAEGGRMQNQTTLRLSSNIEAAQEYVLRAPFDVSVLLESFEYSIPDQIYIPGTDLATLLRPVWNGEESIQSAAARIEAQFRQRVRELTEQQ